MLFPIRRRAPRLRPRFLRSFPGWGVAVLILAGAAAVIPPAAARGLDDEDPGFRTFTSREGDLIRAKILGVADGMVTLVREDGRSFVLPIDRFGDRDRRLLGEWKGPEDPGGAALALGADGPKFHPRLYPRTRDEIREGLATIEKRDLARKGFEKEELEALAVLNQYRFLSGVPSDVVLDPDLVAQAKTAAEGCAGIGRLDHGVNPEAGRCNLHMGGGPLAASIHNYMSDGGENNRAARGHRKWCLNPPMGKTGVGGAAGNRFQAMYAFDASGAKGWKPKNGFTAYPGPGLYPLDFLRTDGWSVYPHGPLPAKDDLEIRVFKLSRRLDAPIPSYREPEHARELDVRYVAVEGSIVFEPDIEKISAGDKFWVRIRGGGLSIAYIVEFTRI